MLVSGLHRKHVSYAMSARSAHDQTSSMKPGDNPIPRNTITCSNVPELGRRT